MDSTNVIYQINEMYNNAFSNLLILSSSLITLVGLIIPITVNYFHQKQVKNEYENIKRFISTEISQQKNELIDFINKEIKNAILKTEDTLNKKYFIAKAGLFHIQASSNLENKFYFTATESACSAIELYFNGDDELNFQRCLNMLKNDCLPHLSKSDFIDSSINDSIDMVLDLLTKNNKNGRFMDVINLIKKLTTLAKNKG